MQAITDRLYIGNSSDGSNEQGLVLAGITASVNVSIDLEMPYYDVIRGNHAGLVCGPGNSAEMIEKSVNSVNKLLEVHPKVLIFCHSGQDRSPLVAAAVLVHELHMTFEGAWKRIQNTLKETELEVTFTSPEVKDSLYGGFVNYCKQIGIGQLVSIVMPCHGHASVTANCLESIRRSTEYTPYEIIGVNDGTPNDKELDNVLTHYCDEIIVHETNMGVAQSRADGNDKARGNIICQIDNDTVFFPNWLTTLVGSLVKVQDIAIIAPLFTCNTQYFAQDITALDAHKYFCVDQVGSACMLYYSELLDLIGNFDPELYNLWEDKDFCYRMTKTKNTEGDVVERTNFGGTHRRKVVIDPRVTVYHSGLVDPKTGMWTTDPNNTRSKKELQNKERIAKSMRLINERWQVKHPEYDRYNPSK